MENYSTETNSSVRISKSSGKAVESGYRSIELVSNKNANNTANNIDQNETLNHDQASNVDLIIDQVFE
jgi:hypothetical protein